jgi:pimeloyl-ACP methyl ester carboxylesterase
MTTSYLDRGDGRRIAYEVHGERGVSLRAPQRDRGGSSEGPLVVCVPGMGDLRSVYRFLIPALTAEGYRVAAMDLRGHGDSDDGFDSYDDVAAGRDALALIDHLGGPALLIGNSMSGGSAVWAAAEAPASVAGLVLMAPFARQPSVGRLQALMFRLAVLKPWGPGVWASYYRRLYPGRPPADLAGHVARIRESLGRGDHWRSFQRTTRTSHAPAEARLGEVRAPTLVVIGDRDPDWPDPVAEARFVAETLRGELLVVPGGGHYPMAEYPELVNPAVVAFAAKACPRA